MNDDDILRWASAPRPGLDPLLQQQLEGLSPTNPQHLEQIHALLRQRQDIGPYTAIRAGPSPRQREIGPRTTVAASPSRPASQTVAPKRSAGPTSSTGAAYGSRQ